MTFNLEKLAQISKPRSEQAIERARLRKQERNKKMSMRTMDVNNIFKEAKFGDKFRTRDGRMALFVEPSVFDKEWYWIAVQDNGTCKYLEDGRILINKEHHLDIIGKWEDEDDRLTIAESKAIIKENTDLKTQLLDLHHIDDEELDRLATTYSSDDNNCCSWYDEIGDFGNDKEDIEKAYKAGFRKAKEQHNFSTIKC